jgi:CrcB protein
MIWQVHQQLFISVANALVYMILTLGGGLIMLKLGNYFGNKIGEAHV